MPQEADSCQTASHDSAAQQNAWVVTANDTTTGPKQRLQQAILAPHQAPQRPADALPDLPPYPVDPRCPYGFNIYVYDLQGENNGQDFLKYALTFRGPFCQDDCSDAQFAAEIHIWRYLLKSPCRTLDPEQAHLFYIPYLESLQAVSPRRPADAFAVLHTALADHEYARLEEVGLIER
jgi:hypothetical protein